MPMGRSSYALPCSTQLLSLTFDPSLPSRLKGAGQRLGASALLCHMHRVSSEESMKHYTMSIANVGDVEAVLCRHGDALLLTRKFVTDEDRDECQRVYKSDGIITEVSVPASFRWFN